MLLCSFRSATHVALLPVPLLTLCVGDKSACPTGCGHSLHCFGTLCTSESLSAGNIHSTASADPGRTTLVEVQRNDLALCLVPAM